MDIKISPSIMCCKVEEYKPYLELFEKVQLDSVHFDIMDGAYVKMSCWERRFIKISSG